MFIRFGHAFRDRDRKLQAPIIKAEFKPYEAAALRKLLNQEPLTDQEESTVTRMMSTINNQWEYCTERYERYNGDHDDDSDDDSQERPAKVAKTA